MNEERTVPVTMGVLIQRIKRKLGHDDRRLRTARRWFSDVGHYYVLGFKDNWIVTRQRRPRSALGRDLGVLKDHEQLLGSWSYSNTSADVEQTNWKALGLEVRPTPLGRADELG